MQIMTVGACGAWYVRPLTVRADIRALSMLWRIFLTSSPSPCRYGCSHNNIQLCPLGPALYKHALGSHTLLLCVSVRGMIEGGRGATTHRHWKRKIHSHGLC